MSKCECKVVRKFALETKKSMHSLCPTKKANKHHKVPTKNNVSFLKKLGIQNNLT